MVGSISRSTFLAVDSTVDIGGGGLRRRGAGEMGNVCVCEAHDVIHRLRWFKLSALVLQNCYYRSRKRRNVGCNLHCRVAIQEFAFWRDQRTEFLYHVICVQVGRPS